MRRVSDCAVVRSTTDGHDAHVASRDFFDCELACDDVTYRTIACGDVTSRDFADCELACGDGTYRNIACGDVTSRDFNGVSNKRGRCSDK